MADYTVIRNSEKDNRSDVVIEYVVPATGDNSAGLQWRAIVAEVRAASEDVGSTLNPRKRTDSVHIAQLDNGELVELSLSVEYDAELGLAAKAAVLDSAVAARVAEFASEFASLYAFYGLVRTA